MRPTAICPNGHVYGVGIEIENSSVLITDVKSRCPFCGKIGYVPDGVYGFVNNAVNLIKELEVSKQEIENLKKTIEEVKRTDPSFENLHEMVSKNNPLLEKLIWLIPQSRDQFIGYLSILVSILIYFISEKSPNSDTIINNVSNTTTIINNYYSKNTVIRSPSNSRKKIGRNEKCHCGSGLKYKKCHGK